MDLATISGIISGLVLIAWSILSGGEISIFINIPSVMIVVGGTIASTLVNFSVKEVIGVMKVVSKAFRIHNTEEITIIEQFVEISKKARKDGILAIDRELHNVKDEFMRTGLEMAVDGIESDTIRDILEIELMYLKSRHRRGQQIFAAMGAYSPAFGMIGTLIGLIQMLSKMSDPSTIGSGMAVALITTFYGAILANLVFLPIAGKLRNRSDEEISLKEMIIEGVLAIQMGEHPRNIRRKLMNFIAPKERGGSEEQRGKE